ncbi:MAG: DUF1566 domain-containing protein [Methylococcales bacterium]|nr:DUF1566 domain-containing protein [Methylococcales bacterium]
MILKNVCAVFLLFAATASASQDPASQSTYDPQTHRLKIPVLKAGRDYLSAELVDQGGYQFTLQQSAAYAGVVPDSYPGFDAVSGLLSIPNLSAFGNVWTVTLQHSGNFVFKLATATEVNTTPILDPLEAMTPKERYSINNDGTVTDKVTGLQWMRCSQGQEWKNNTCSGYPVTVEMEDAAYSAYSLTFAGKDDWRLPSVDELKTLVYCSSGKPKFWNTSGRACNGDYQQPTLAPEAFPYTSSGVYWSITNLQNDPGQDYNLTVSFNYGHVYYSYFKDAYERARFVRGASNIIPAPEYIGGFKE